MDIPQEGRAALSATARAEEIIDRTGQRLSLLALLTRQRLQEGIASIRSEADRMDQPGPGKGARAKTITQQQPARSALPVVSAQAEIARAEEMVSKWGERIGLAASLTNLQIQRIVARMREEAEDMWVEAQDIRGRRQ
jgi:hypothetical protein